jgi:transposase-like protein
MKKLIEQTEIARKLGISNNAFRRIASTARLEFELINNKRHYDWQEVLEIIKKGKNG